MRRLMLWFGLLGGGTAWTLHLLLAYLIAEFGCVSGQDSIVVGGIALPALLLLLMSVLMFTVAAGAALAARLAGRRLARDGDHDRGGQAVAAERAMARTGLYASALFAFIIVVQSVPIVFYVRGC